MAIITYDFVDQTKWERLVAKREEEGGAKKLKGP
jgi:hypothetical protein